ncbi:MAG: hypothetical protein AB8G22_15945 [Saprospiraceae bacterium]
MALSPMSLIPSYLSHLFSATHRSLTPQLVIIARFLALLTLLHHYFPFPFRTPFFTFLITEEIPYNLITRYVMWMGCLLVLLTKHVRLGTAACGLSLWVGLLLCRSCHSNAHMYLASIFLVISCSNSLTKNRLLQAQVIILYLGAFLVKVIDPDWWNGNYFETLMIRRHHLAWYSKVAALFSGQLFSAFMGIFVIVIELLIPILLLRKKWWHYGLAIALTFHTVMIIMMNITFGPFYFSLAASYLIFIRHFANFSLHNNFLHRYPNFGRFLLGDIKVSTTESAKLQTSFAANTRFSGYFALVFTLVRTPLAWYSFALLTWFFHPMNCIIIGHLLLLPYYLYLLRRWFLNQLKFRRTLIP